MKFLAIEQEVPGTSAADFALHSHDEARRVWELYQQGIIREMYFHAEEHVAVLILECADRATAQQTLDSLPLVQAGLITFQVIPLLPYDGFSRLFATDNI